MANKIIKKEKLAENIFRFVLDTPQIAKNSKPGQFVIIRINETGERIPLTIAGAATVILAIGAGKKAAIAINDYLKSGLW